jgi:hypothetical protein
MNATARKTARWLAVLIGCAVVACGVGSAFAWTLTQALTMAVSLGLLAYWTLRLRSGDDAGILGRPVVGLAVIVGLVLLAWAAFIFHPTGGLTGTPVIGQPYVRMPRFLSMIVALLPAAPCAAHVFVALVPRREG